MFRRPRRKMLVRRNITRSSSCPAPTGHLFGLAFPRAILVLHARRGFALQNAKSPPGPRTRARQTGGGASSSCPSTGSQAEKRGASPSRLRPEAAGGTFRGLAPGYHTTEPANPAREPHQSPFPQARTPQWKFLQINLVYKINLFIFASDLMLNRCATGGGESGKGRLAMDNN